MLGVLALFLAYLSCQIRALVGWSGNWRLGALLPALAMAAIIFRFTIDVITIRRLTTSGLLRLLFGLSSV